MGRKDFDEDEEEEDDEDEEEEKPKKRGRPKTKKGKKQEVVMFPRAVSIAEMFNVICDKIDNLAILISKEEED